VRRAGARERHKPEFSQWRWERLERLPELVIPFKRPVYEKVIETLGPLVRATTK